MLAPAFHSHHDNIPVIKTVASQQTGIAELAQAIEAAAQQPNEKKRWLLTEKAWQLIQDHRMKDVKKDVLAKEISEELQAGSFNLYRLAAKFF